MGFRTAAKVVIVVAALISCSSSSGPADDDFESVVGKFCTNPGATVTREGNNATVVLRENNTRVREVTDAQGFRRQQTVRSCEEKVCVILGGANSTDAELIRICEGM